MSGWEDVPDDSPFGGVEAVDGLVYSQDDNPVELRAQTQVPQVPLPPTRPAPIRQRPEAVAPWTTTEVDRSAYAPKVKRRNPALAILIGMVPLALVFIVLMAVLQLYGFK